jgi:hypothetical protein
MFFNNNKRKIALFVLFFFLFSFPIKIKESYANPVALEVVLWGVAAVLTAAGIMVATGDTESLIYAVNEYWDSLKAPEKAMYERMAIEAKEQGNAPLSDYLWNKANLYAKSTYNPGVNTIEPVVSATPGVYYDPNTIYIGGKKLSVEIVTPGGNSTVMNTFLDGVQLSSYTINTKYAWNITKNEFRFLPSSTNVHHYIRIYHSGYFSQGIYQERYLVSSIYKSTLIDFFGSEPSVEIGNDKLLLFNEINPEEFNYSTPVPPGVVPERRIAYPSHVFNPNNDIDGILEPLTGKTAQDIWGATGAYSENTTTFDPISGDNPILPWIPIADPSTFTPAGELPAEIIATAPSVLDGTNSDLNSISGSLGSIWDILKTGFNALIDTIWTGISHLLDGLGSISLLLKSVFDLINSGISAIVGAISSIWDLVYDGFASVAAALRGILDQVANVAGYLNPASDTFFLRTALVPDVAVLNGFVESLNINFQEKFQIAAAYEEFQSYKDTDHESEFEDIYVDLPIWGMQCICNGEFVNTAGQQFKSVVAAFLIMLTVIFCFKRIATIGSK